MKKLFTLIALVGMGAFVAGCAEESKPPAKPSPAVPTTGPGSVNPQPGPKASSATDEDKMDEDKADADKADDDAAKPDADKTDEDGDKKEE